MMKINLDDVAAAKHFKAVQKQIQQRAVKILRLGYIKKDSSNIYLDADCSIFLECLLEDGFLENIICVSPTEMPDLIDDIRRNFPALLNDGTNGYKIVYNLFVNHGYDSVVFDKHAFIEYIGKDTCLYCNRNYIYSLSKADKIKPEIDHFYPKGLYPFLGLTYYNLIPSCETCNGVNAKKDQDPFICKLTNPYLIKDTDFLFDFFINTIHAINPIPSLNSISVVFKSGLAPHLTVFKLDRLYEKHTEHVLELIIKSKIKYTAKYRSYLKSYSGMKFSEEEINRLIIGNYTDINNLHKRPLSKLYSDISRKLGLI